MCGQRMWGPCELADSRCFMEGGVWAGNARATRGGGRGEQTHHGWCGGKGRADGRVEEGPVEKLGAASSVIEAGDMRLEV